MVAMEKDKKSKSINLILWSELFQSFEKSLGFKNKIKWNTAIGNNLSISCHGCLLELQLRFSG